MLSASKASFETTAPRSPPAAAAAAADNEAAGVGGTGPASGMAVLWDWLRLDGQGVGRLYAQVLAEAGMQAASLDLRGWVRRLAPEDRHVRVTQRRHRGSLFSVREANQSDVVKSSIGAGRPPLLCLARAFGRAHFQNGDDVCLCKL